MGEAVGAWERQWGMVEAVGHGRGKLYHYYLRDFAVLVNNRSGFSERITLSVTFS
jgi:hypothetical protein